MNYRTDIEIADEIERQNQADISELTLLRRGLVDEQQRRIAAERKADQLETDYLETREEREQAITALRYVEFYMIDVKFPKDHHALLAVQKALASQSDAGAKP